MNNKPEQLFRQWLEGTSPLSHAEQAELLALGLDTFRPIDAIDQKLIQSGIDFSDIKTIFSTESTQQNVQANSTLIAEHQSAGVGQRGKTWLTPLGLSICLSHRFFLAVPIQQMPGYTLSVALACLQSIKHFDKHAAVTIKWPNDLYCHGVKFAGILTHVNSINKKNTEITLGIGINWQLGPQHFAQIDQAVCNIPLNTRLVGRNEFIIELLKQIKHNNQQFTQHGCAAFLDQWQKHDQLVGQQITLKTASETFNGTYAGINAKGEIQLNINGQLHRFASGEAQIMKKDV